MTSDRLSHEATKALQKKKSTNAQGFVKLLYIMMHQCEPFLSTLMSIFNDICTDTGPA